MQDIVTRFESSLWKDVSGFHDARIVKIGIDAAEGTIEVAVIAEREVDGATQDVILTFGEFSELSITTPKSSPGVEGYEFPRNALVESIDASRFTADVADFEIRGVYGWRISFKAASFQILPT